MPETNLNLDMKTLDGDLYMSNDYDSHKVQL